MKILGNCLLAAVFAWLKDPFNTKILLYPRCINNNKLHLVWINKKTKTVSHFRTKLLNTKFSPLFFGVVKSYSLEMFEIEILKLCCTCNVPTHKKLEIAKKFGFPLGCNKKVTNWKYLVDIIDGKACKVHPKLEENPYYLKKFPYIKVMFSDGYEEPLYTLKKLDLGKDDILDDSDLNQTEGGVVWKYITPYDEDYMGLTCLDFALQDVKYVSDEELASYGLNP